MSWPIIIITIIIGLVLVALEIVALPGGVAGVCGGILTIVAIWQTYATHGTLAGNIVLISSLAICGLLIAFFMKSKTWRFFSLNDKVDSKVNTVEQQGILPGAEGITISRLAPSGKALINGETCEVHTENEFVDPNHKIVVVDVDGYKIIVKEVK